MRALGIALTIMIAAAAWSAAAQTFDAGKLDTFVEGETTKADVLKAIGRPSREMPSLERHTTFIYEFRGKPAADGSAPVPVMLVVLFDPQGKFVRYRVYGPKSPEEAKAEADARAAPVPQFQWAGDASIMREFDRFCVPNEADPTAVLALVDAEGWKKSSAQDREREVTDPNGRRTAEHLSVVDIPYRPPGAREPDRKVRTRACAISLWNGDPTAVKAAARAWAGFDPITSGSDSVWLYQMNGAERAPLKDVSVEAVRQASTNGRVMVLYAMGGAGPPFIYYGSVLPPR